LPFGAKSEPRKMALWSSWAANRQTVQPRNIELHWISTTRHNISRGVADSRVDLHYTIPNTPNNTAAILHLPLICTGGNTLKLSRAQRRLVSRVPLAKRAKRHPRRHTLSTGRTPMTGSAASKATTARSAAIHVETTYSTETSAARSSSSLPASPAPPTSAASRPSIRPATQASGPSAATASTISRPTPACPSSRPSCCPFRQQRGCTRDQ